MKCTYKSSSNTTYKSSSNTILKGQQPSSTEATQEEATQEESVEALGLGTTNSNDGQREVVFKPHPQLPVGRGPTHGGPVHEV